MTKNTITIELTCNGRTLIMGPNSDMDITKVSGLESATFEVSTSDNVLIDGAHVDGKKIKPRSIHIEASFKSNKNNAENRQRIIRFFNPKYTGKARITNMGVTRTIDYELEGWTFKQMVNMDQKLAILVDLICPDPYMLSIDNFGKNMAGVTGMFAFPWRVTKTRLTNKKNYPSEARGLLLGGMPAGYRTLRKEAVISNDGDVETGVQVQLVASRGPVKNPIIEKRVGDTTAFIKVNVDMAAGDALFIDTSERHQVIELNGTNVYQKIDRASSPFLLDTGDNYIEYNADEGYTNLDVNLYYTPKYLGV